MRQFDTTETFAAAPDLKTETSDVLPCDNEALFVSLLKDDCGSELLLRAGSLHPHSSATAFGRLYAWITPAMFVLCTGICICTLFAGTDRTPMLRKMY